ncbi:conjugal transfer protein, partial [Methylobacterium sp. BTF04]|nr:conjugal transfer protein [Methylobacterium sp. BTF04]
RDAAALNRAAREVLRTEGAITGPDVEVQARDRENKPVMLALARGNRIRFGEGLIRHGIRNGTRATIEAVGADDKGILKLRVRLDDGRVVEDAYGSLVREQVPGARSQRSSALPRISHAWAGTAYSVQGKTAAASVYYGSTASDARELYVGLTRHTQDAWLVVERARLETSVRLRRNDAGIKPCTAELHERLFVEARRYAEKTNVVDHIEDRAAFVQTGKLPRPKREAAIDTRYEFEAGRALRAVLMQIGAHPRLLLRQLGHMRREAERKISDRFTAIVDALRKPVTGQTPNRTLAPRRRGQEIDR